MTLGAKLNCLVIVALVVFTGAPSVSAQALYEIPEGVETRWASPENPTGERGKGAQAMGATRWEMIRLTVLPFGKSAIISSSMLGLGRALGETMAVAIVLSVSGGITFNLISSGNPSTIAANIALEFPESSGIDINTLIASGLALFVITLAVNMLARAIVNRRADFSGAN